MSTSWHDAIGGAPPPRNDEAPAATEASRTNTTNTMNVDAASFLSNSSSEEVHSCEPARKGYGASEAEWCHLDLVLGLTEDLLPVVSNPTVPTSPNSELPDINRGKVPSEIRHGKVGGFKEWTKKRSTGKEIDAWSKNPDLGICVQTREVRAIDIDIADTAIAQQVVDLVEKACGPLPKRMRGNSGKCLLAFRMPGMFSKRKFSTSATDNSQIEFLATGQQFIAIGTHPSGERYKWAGGLPNLIPDLSVEVFTQLWARLSEQFGVDQAAQPTTTASDRNGSRVPGDLDRMGTLHDVNDETVEDVRSALEAFTAADADNYDLWIELGLEIKSIAQAGWKEDALEMWHELSAKSPRYDRDQTQAKWRTLNPDRVTFKTIFKMAAERGWVNPRSAEAMKANATAASRLDRTDAGNVARLAIQVDGNLRFVPERRTWLWWCGERWTPDSYGTEAQDAALQVAEYYHRQAAEIREQVGSKPLDDAERKRIDKAVEGVEKWANQCRNKKAIDSMLALAKCDDRFTLAAGELDQDPWLFGVANGVVDLRNGQLRKAARDEFVTRRAPVNFEPNAEAPRWLQFIGEITSKPTGTLGNYRARPQLAAYLQRALGYSMTGSTDEQKMFIAIGSGSNGKNVLLDYLQWLMGDYCQTIPPEALMAMRNDADAERPSPTTASLAGARAAISSESKAGARLDVALVKRQTGGGYMTARYMRENTFRFEISHKLWLHTNHKPAMDHMDDAVRGRVHLIPFDMQWNRPGHPERNPNWPDADKELPARLKDEAEGVLAWLVRGSVDYVRDGLETPSEVENMTRHFFNDLDPFGRWLEACTRCDAKVGMKAAELFHAFGNWRHADGEEGGPSSQKAFSTDLVARGISKHVAGDGNYYGIRAVPSHTSNFPDFV